MKITRRTEQEINISELKAAIKEGRGLEVIRPHDEITLALDTGETITPVCGYVGKHSARFVFKDCLREMWQMNKDMTNKGGYFRSEARRHVLEDILPHLPAELREAITPRHLCEEIDGETYEYFDSLWLPSATDVFGNDPEWMVEGRNRQLPVAYFKEERDRVKERTPEMVHIRTGSVPRRPAFPRVSCLWMLTAWSPTATRTTRVALPPALICKIRNSKTSPAQCRGSSRKEARSYHEHRAYRRRVATISRISRL